MIFSSPVERQLKHLRRDAACVAHDLSRLSQEIARNGRSGGSRLPRQMLSDARVQFGQIGERLVDLRDGARQSMAVVHGKLQETPIRYAVGAMAAGIAVGMIANRLANGRA